MDNAVYQLTFLVTFAAISLAAVKRTATSVEDFAVASRSLSARGVSWVIIGTLVGGVSTIGTVQTAYTHGISAGIFTFGSGLSCLLLGCFFARALREEGVVTISEYLGRFFGQRFRYYCSFINSLGMFIHVVGQFLAAIAILQAVFHFGDSASVLITLGLLAVFVICGGIGGAGLIGKIKFFMLYAIMIISAVVAINAGGGLGGILAGLPEDMNMLGFTHYGLKTATIDLLSMIVGVLSTQIYLQAIFAAKDVREARNGAFLSAAVIPPIGILGIIIGLFLRANHPEVAASPAQALPYFLQVCFPPVVAALFSAGLLLIVLGTGAGLVLGVTTNIYNDFLSAERWRKNAQPLRMVRFITLAVLLLASMLVFTGLDSTILRWSYLSMGLRGSAVFAGLVMLVFFSKIATRPVIRFLLYILPIIYVMLNIN
jgi:SSS family solute:Na+ symporter